MTTLKIEKLSPILMEKIRATITRGCDKRGENIGERSSSYGRGHCNYLEVLTPEASQKFTAKKLFIPYL